MKFRFFFSFCIFKFGKIAREIVFLRMANFVKDRMMPPSDIEVNEPKSVNARTMKLNSQHGLSQQVWVQIPAGPTLSISAFPRFE
jgi:hypothetical protein